MDSGANFTGGAFYSPPGRAGQATNLPRPMGLHSSSSNVQITPIAPPVQERATALRRALRPLRPRAWRPREPRPATREPADRRRAWLPRLLIGGLLRLIPPPRPFPPPRPKHYRLPPG